MNGSLILNEARDMQEWLTATRRRLHQTPEPGDQENATSAFIEEQLHSMGIETLRHGTALLGLIRGGQDGPCVALRADMDGLPVQEPAGCAFASRNPGYMHACGHDAHCAILLGAARWLAGRRQKLSGTVKLFFQPAEETDGGAQNMVDQGWLKAPEVERVYGLHVMPYLPTGYIETRRGSLNGCSTRLEIIINGKGGHAAYPESGIDAILIAGHVITALNCLPARYVSPLDSAVLTIGKINGGSRSNIIAEEVRMSATLRAASDQTRDLMIARAQALVGQISQAHGGEGRIEVTYGYAALVNHDCAVDSIVSVSEAVLGEKKLVWKERPSMGVEDFSFFIRETPGAFYHLGCGGAEPAGNAPLHSPDFKLDEACLAYGVALQVGLVLETIERAGKELP